MATTPARPRFLFARRPDLERVWPYVPERLVARLSQLGSVEIVQAAPAVPLHEQADLRDVTGVALFGGALTVACVAAAPALRVVGCMTDGTGHGLPLAALASRGIPAVDATRAWAQSVAEVALCLALCALRRVPQWHASMAAGEPLWSYPAAQFCDDPGFVNGDLGARRVGVVGLGQIGRRVAQWCRALGAGVDGYDPFLPRDVVHGWGVRPVALDDLVDAAEVLFVAVPPTPSARHLLNAERIGRLRRGALVVVVTRAHAVDMAALRQRILADELAGAFDVYDVEPLPVDDLLRGRANVVHTPHIAGRTRDANLRVADVLADDFARVLRGEEPQARLVSEAVAVRTSVQNVPW
jgi:D-3-phosphoglycerate dehydrogenase